MTTDRLREHYETKYSEEGTTGQDELVVFPLRLPTPIGRYEAATAALADKLRDKDVLELGAGAGHIAHSLEVGESGFASYTLGDISQPRLDGLARRLDPSKFQFKIMDADDVNGSVDDKFDVIIMIALIEHLVDPLRAMTAIRAALKPGGFVYIDTPNIAKWTRRIKLALGRFPSTASGNEGLTTYEGPPADLHDEGHLHYFTFRSLDLMLTRRCGFSKVAHFGYAPEPKPFGRALGTRLATARPQMFSEIACLAYA